MRIDRACCTQISSTAFSKRAIFRRSAAALSSLDVQDFNHDGLLDLVSYSPEIFAVRNDSGKLVLAANAKTAPSPIRADFNGDQREDYARLLPDGSLHIYTNASPDQRWLSVRIEGTKNLKEAAGATVEMKSGAFYDKRIYDGVPLAFATDGHADVDTIRITWPNGLIQNETRKKSGEALTIAEAQRLSGSCPMIFAWNGQAFQFITDVLGVAPLGRELGRRHLFSGGSPGIYSDSGFCAEGGGWQISDPYHGRAPRGVVPGQDTAHRGGSSFGCRHLYERKIQIAAVSRIPALRHAFEDSSRSRHG